MSVETVQLGNEGLKIIVNIKQPDGTARDLTGATNLKIKLKSNLATAGKTFTAVIEGVATNGAVSCILTAGTIDSLGLWTAQAYYELGAFKGHTKPEELFYVEGNLA